MNTHGYLACEAWLQGDEGQRSIKVPEQLGSEHLDEEKRRGGPAHGQVRCHHRQCCPLTIQCHSAWKQQHQL